MTPELQEGQSSALRIRTNRFGKKLVKVAFTGGPCAGKSTAIEEISQRVRREHDTTWQVFSAAEAASLLYSGGVCRDELTNAQLQQWQTDMLRMIVRIESVFEKIAENEPKRHTLLLCDRGCLDPKVYTPPVMWSAILRDLCVSEVDLFSRYDKVIQLQTAPKRNYCLTNNKSRREDYEKAALVNNEFSKVWDQHPRFINILDNEDDCWSQKLQEAWREVFALLQ